LSEVAVTKKRKLAVLAVAAVGLAVGPLLYLQHLPKTPLRAGYDRVRQGMTTEEVHAAMAEFGPFDPYLSVVDGEADRVEVYFNNDHTEALAVFRITQGRVAEKSFHQRSWTANQLEDVREWLGL
jgi:hypothetical protein